ncbi:hypothetical protein BAUCODRAFT_38462 [Baudoinia panamericana UAMH 10762]|uniref:Uncharacterized protein n=1 Tax=Baudoinia panamericana (strain UAMH 10762) TaxID=717646 RepID=M2MLZ2_BAUPA|nr:uncharacterized protein BAUCODRAFT_38462 [Baudoinia panamericana UAMH 10762]EMC92408.1 hypothetical protein BAUCODRAFT_38462 [Baudoinia panamericana UAMH 10762]
MAGGEVLSGSGSRRPENDIPKPGYAGTSKPTGDFLGRSISPRDIPADPYGYHKPDEQPVEGYYHHVPGPHATDIANVLDPHVPGEYPTEDGEDRHKVGYPAAGLGAVGLGAAGYEAKNEQFGPSTTTRGVEPSSQGYHDTTTQAVFPASAQTASMQQPQQQYARDAAVAGGVGAAGLGAAGYESKNDRFEPSATAEAVVPSSQGYHDSTTKPAFPAAAETAPVQQHQQHQARDATVAGGVGTAGVGAYETTRDRGDTGPAPNTVGPHSSDVLNVLDPRVRPEPEKMKDHTTAGPYSSDMANKVDPRVQSDPAKAQSNESHFGRDAALAGGAGAAGVGAYEAERSRQDTGPASKTIGPHDSNVANVLDPRVKPEPEKMKDQTTAGPYRSNIANRADPRVEHQPTKTAVKEARKAETHTSHSAETSMATPSSATSGEDPRPAKQELIDAINRNEGHDKHGHNVLHKSEKQQLKHEHDLEKAREREAEIGGDRGEHKKEGLLSKILHRSSGEHRR